MKSIFSKILISLFALGIFLLPVSLDIQPVHKNHHLALQVSSSLNVAEAFPAFNWPSPWNWILSGVVKAAAAVLNWILNIIFAILAQLSYFAARILDFFIFYSLGSAAYKSDFIEAAWGTVRDVANIFFLLGLLYVAIQLVLDIHVSEKKKMIGQIIVMALLVNFSLFATQVVIDASNVLARVFYNQIESKDEVGNDIPKEKQNTEPKSITLGIVDAFDPQTILTNTKGTDDKYEVLILILLIAIMGYLTYMFLTVAFLFVGRVVSLWVAMIFAPLAFMSRALGIKALDDLSWGKWSENLFKSAFMAPLFIFFLYIILLLSKWLTLLQQSINLSDKGGDPGVLKMMNVIIPFAIIFTLLMKAKSLAVKYSGDIGKALSGVGTALGGLALGGAALGTAFAGRQTIGAFAKYSTNDDKRKAAIDKFNDMKWYQKANIFKSGSALRGGWSAKFSEFATGTKRDATTGNVDTKGFIGRGIDKATKTFKEKKEASDTISRKISEMSESLHIEKDAKFDDIPKDKAQKIIDAINADIVSKEMYKGRVFKELNDREKTTVRDAVIEEITTGSNTGKIAFYAVDTKGNTYGMPTIPTLINKKGAGEIIKDSKKNTSYYSATGELIGSASKGGYDIRNISKLSSKQLTMVVGLLAGIAGLLRSGLKQGHIDPGVGQKDFFKDLTSVISSAVKSSGLGSISSGGGHDNHADDHGGGDHGHGGGGHH